MDAYQLLRQQAAEKRDSIIRAARGEYRRALREIEALRRGIDAEPLTPKLAGTNQAIMEKIRDLMPKDRAFTVRDIADLLTQANPGRTFRPMTLRYFFPRMQKRGTISKVGRNISGEILWAAVGVQVVEAPGGAEVMIDMAEKVLREHGPMTPLEVVVKMQERGYRPKSDPRRLVGWLRRAANTYQGRCVVRDDGQWTSCAALVTSGQATDWSGGIRTH